MNWRPTLFLSSFTVSLLLIVPDDRRNSVKAIMRGFSEEIPGSWVPLVRKKKLFMQRLDASNFLKKQEIRSVRSNAESDDRTDSASEYESSSEDWEAREERNRGRGWPEYEFDEYFD